MHDKRRRQTGWLPSQHNFVPEVVDTLSFPERVLVHDVTLRDGEQQAGIVFTKADKLRIATALDSLGVHRIEAGMPAVSEDDAAAIREIVRLKLKARIFAFSRCTLDDVKRACDTGISGVVMEVPSSEHMIERAYRWPLSKAIKASVEATAYAHEQGLEVVFFPIDLMNRPGFPGASVT